MKLELKAKHFEGTSYADWGTDCAIEKAYTELTASYCSEGITTLNDFTEDKCFRHSRYGIDDFKSDKLKAESHNWDDNL